MSTVSPRAGGRMAMVLKVSKETRWASEGGADADDGAEEAHLLDRAAEGGVVAGLGAEGERLGAEREGDLGAGGRGEGAAEGHRLAVDGDGAGGGVGDAGLERVQRADEGGDEGGGRAVVDLERVADLLGDAGVHHHDAVGHRQRLFLVVGDVDGGDAELALDRADLVAERDADLGVERRERLVEQQHLRPRGEGAGERHALLLAAGELEGVAGAEVGQAR